MQASNFGGTFDQLFLWIFLWNFHRRCLSTSSIPWCKKSKKWTKNSNQVGGGGGSCHNRRWNKIPISWTERVTPQHSSLPIIFTFPTHQYMNFYLWTFRPDILLGFLSKKWKKTNCNQVIKPGETLRDWLNTVPYTTAWKTLILNSIQEKSQYQTRKMTKRKRQAILKPTKQKRQVIWNRKERKHNDSSLKSKTTINRKRKNTF